MGRFAIYESVSDTEVRLFLNAECGKTAFEKRQDYDVKLDLRYETPEVVFVSGLQSRVKLTREDFEQLKEFGRAKGVKKIRFERAGEIFEEVL